MTEKLLVPDIGEFENVEVIEVLVKEGQSIKKNDSIVTIESDKSSVEIPSTVEGKIEKVDVKTGDKVSKGDTLLIYSSIKKSLSESETVPKNTENLIKEAEISLKKSQEQNIEDQKTEKQKLETIKILNDGDLDPVETDLISAPSNFILKTFGDCLSISFSPI